MLIVGASSSGSGDAILQCTGEGLIGEDAIAVGLKIERFAETQGEEPSARVRLVGRETLCVDGVDGDGGPRSSGRFCSLTASSPERSCIGRSAGTGDSLSDSIDLRCGI